MDKWNDEQDTPYRKPAKKSSPKKEKHKHNYVTFDLVRVSFESKLIVMCEDCGKRPSYKNKERKKFGEPVGQISHKNGTYYEVKNGRLIAPMWD